MLTISACRHRASAIPAGGTTAPGVREQGVTSVRFLTGDRKLEEGQELQPPRPKSILTLPEYPPGALAAHAGSAVVVLRFVVSVEGEVTDIVLSPRGGTTEGPFTQAFCAAAEAAVRSWRYSPAELQWVVPGRDLNGDGRPDFRRVIRREAIPVYLDVRFEFQIVAGKPHVR
jgi:hypothetical protein